MDGEIVTEEWRPIPSAPGYEASSIGRIRSLKHRYGPRKAPKIIRTHANRLGYLQVSLSFGGKGYQRTVHRLVLEAFRGCGEGLVCRHLDGTRTNNAIANLAWGTQVENAADRDAHGRTAIGPLNNKTKLTREKVLSIRANRDNKSMTALAREHGVTRHAIVLIVRRINWRHVS